MNSKTMKKISRHSEVLLMEWLKGLVPEEEHHKISPSNLHSLLPSNNYLYVNDQFRLNICSYKWVRKGLKRLVSKGKQLENITMKDLENEYKKESS